MKIKLLILSFLLCSAFAQAQNTEHKWSIGANIGAFDYFTPLNQKFFNTDKWKFNPSFTLSRYLSPSFDLTGRFSYGDVVLHPEHLTDYGYSTIKRGLHDYDLLLRYKFNNGIILDEDAKFYPYLTAGFGFNRIVDNTHAVVPFGLGFGLKLSPRLTALLESNYKMPFGMNAQIGRSEHLYHSLGLSYAFGNHKPKVYDRDHDGVTDNIDHCPDVAGVAALQGCPDKDGDGVADKDDRCPDIAGVPALMGCPDKDGDGVPDYLDRCPDVYGLRETLGCPKEAEKVQRDTVIEMPKKPVTPNVDDIPADLVKRVFYLVYQFDLSKENYQILDTVVNMLNTYPTLKIQIGGHTDNSGGDKINMPLSVKRAEKVKQYFLIRGIETSRVFAFGYASTYPLVPNDTKEHRAMNRRTEIRFQKR